MFDRILKICLLFSLHIFSTITQKPRPPDDIYLKHQFNKSLFVPNIIPEAPKQRCYVTYKEHGIVYPGERLYPKLTMDAPNVTWDEADPNCLYTIYMTGFTNWTLYITPLDPNDQIYPDRIYHEYHQWLVVNIPGNDVKKGKTLYNYQSPGAPVYDFVKDVYAFLIYKQQNEIIPPKPRWFEWYMFQEFSPTVKFAKQYNLTGPIAGNLFYAVY